MPGIACETDTVLVSDIVVLLSRVGTGSAVSASLAVTLPHFEGSVPGKGGLDRSSSSDHGTVSWAILYQPYHTDTHKWFIPMTIEVSEWTLVMLHYYSKQFPVIYLVDY